MDKVKSLLRAEGLLLFIAAFVLYWQFDFALVWFAVFLLAPDISMIGYLKDTKVGAFFYNLGHSMVIPLVMLIVAVLGNESSLFAAGLIWLAHIGMDRFFGYGLKLDSGFKDTHLGKITSKLR